MTARAHHSNWLVPPAGSFDPYRGSYVGANPTQADLLSLEQIHKAAAEKAELESRWQDAAKEWDLAAAMASQYAAGASVTEKEQAHQRFEEYHRRQAAALSQVKLQASKGPLGTAVLIAGGGAILYFFAPGLALGALGALWSGTKRASSYVAGKAKGAVT